MCSLRFICCQKGRHFQPTFQFLYQPAPFLLFLNPLRPQLGSFSDTLLLLCVSSRMWDGDVGSISLLTLTPPDQRPKRRVKPPARQRGGGAAFMSSLQSCSSD